MKITKKMFILLISIVLYSCGPSACDCLHDINGYGLRTVSQGCFDKFGNDKFHGQGIQIWSNGDRYEGDFFNDEK